MKKLVVVLIAVSVCSSLFAAEKKEVLRHVTEESVNIDELAEDVKLLQARVESLEERVKWLSDEANKHKKHVFGRSCQRSSLLS